MEGDDFDGFEGVDVAVGAGTGAGGGGGALPLWCCLRDCSENMKID